MATERKRRGRPSGYLPEFAAQALKLCRLGAIDRDLADFFEVHVDTIAAWKSAHPEFSEALKAGKTTADAAVTDSLFRRACGYDHPAVKIMQYEGEAVVVDYVERYAPDTTACIFWLKNRRPDLWRDVQSREHSGPDGGPIEMTVEERRREVARKQELARSLLDRVFGRDGGEATRDGEKLH